MKYMLLIYGDENALSTEERDACYRESIDLAHELKEAGTFVSTAPLQATAVATSVQVRQGKRLITDGPFAETHEQLGGYFMVDVPNLDGALEIAARIPGARGGTVEVRPVVELQGLPETS